VSAAAATRAESPACSSSTTASRVAGSTARAFTDLRWNSLSTATMTGDAPASFSAASTARVM
jgi:hypothetical protein